MPYTISSDLSAASNPGAHTPARAAVAITPSDTVDLAPYAKALKCNTAGNLYVLPVANYQAGSTTPVRLVVTAGEYVPVQVARVFATSTTVSDIVALSQ